MNAHCRSCLSISTRARARSLRAALGLQHKDPQAGVSDTSSSCICNVEGAREMSVVWRNANMCSVHQQKTGEKQQILPVCQRIYEEERRSREGGSGDEQREQKGWRETVCRLVQELFSCKLSREDNTLCEKVMEWTVTGPESHSSSN